MRLLPLARGSCPLLVPDARPNSAQVLSRLFELPCHDFVMLDDAAQAQVLTRGTQKLAALEGVMRIEVNPADRLPTVRRIGTLAKADLWNMARVLESSL